MQPPERKGATAMNKNTVRQIIVLVAIVATFAMNTLANTLPLNNLNTGEISDRFDIYFVPAGYVFSIWFLIYAGLIAFAIWQVLPAQAENPRLQKIGYLILLSCVANVTWLFLWHYEVFSLTLIAMVVLLLSLIAIYLRLGTGRTAVSTAETWLARVPFSIYLGWVTVATIANATQLLYYLEWGGWGIAPQVWAVIMLVVATAVASLVVLTRVDVAYMLVIIWAFIGIAIEHAATPVVSRTAWVLAAVCAFVLVVVGAMRRSRRRRGA
jgi:hypothetical protein